MVLDLAALVMGQALEVARAPIKKPAVAGFLLASVRLVRSKIKTEYRRRGLKSCWRPLH